MYDRKKDRFIADNGENNLGKILEEIQKFSGLK